MEKIKKILEYSIYILIALVILAPVIGFLIFLILVQISGLGSYVPLPDFGHWLKELGGWLWAVITSDPSYVGTFYSLYAYYAILALALLHAILFTKRNGFLQALIHPTAIIAYFVAVILILL